MTRRFALILAALMMSAAADAAPRVALVIGAGDYATVPKLPNPPRDARAIADALRRLGFETSLLIDPDRAAMERAIRALGDAAQPSGGQPAEAAMVFYAGHALEAGGRNLLVPVSARVTAARDLPFETVDLDLVLNGLDGRARTIMIFLDSCRDNPFARTLGASGRGIASRGMAAPASDVTGTLIAFATAPGRTAADGAGEHSPFTTALLRHIEEPGLDVRQLLAVVRKEVREATGGEQIPWESSALEAGFAFRPAASASSVPAPLPAASGQHCHVPKLTGSMRQGGAAGTMQVSGDGRGCGFSVWRRVAAREPYDGLAVSVPPRQGTVSIQERHRIVYTAKAGYVGPDEFTVASTPAGTLAMKVTVTKP